jgi:polyprenyl P-hydroxybenzoate/phenylacrylic acid decarboxylase-like protein
VGMALGVERARSISRRRCDSVRVGTNSSSMPPLPGPRTHSRSSDATPSGDYDRDVTGTRRIVVGVAAGDGLDHTIRLLERLREAEVEIHLVVTPAAEAALADDIGRVLGLATYRYDHDNQAARIASGSFVTHGMVVAPCDAATLRAIVHGLASDLVLRAADVTLKERRPLVIGLSAVVQEASEDLVRAANLPRVALVPLSGVPGDNVDRLLDQLAVPA